jgi:hypothetical protein
LNYGPEETFEERIQQENRILTGQLFSEKDLKFAPKDITGSNVLQNPFLNTVSGTMSPLFQTRLSIPHLFQGRIPHPGPAGT